uniref:Transmembrane protein n=1 Tax=Setaria viridis TaxID=4556 RepID=A0A4U6UQN1_SETVI|nr:hypothetical protein SEVIR_5G446050v2 [Setaria viridis]
MIHRARAADHVPARSGARKPQASLSARGGSGPSTRDARRFAGSEGRIRRARGRSFPGRKLPRAGVKPGAGGKAKAEATPGDGDGRLSASVCVCVTKSTKLVVWACFACLYLVALFFVVGLPSCSCLSVALVFPTPTRCFVFFTLRLVSFQTVILLTSTLCQQYVSATFFSPQGVLKGSHRMFGC